jgi:hypothetical protein
VGSNMTPLPLEGYRSCMPMSLDTLVSFLGYEDTSVSGYECVAASLGALQPRRYLSSELIFSWVPS